MGRRTLLKIIASFAVTIAMMFGSTSSTHASVQRLLLKHGAEEEDAVRKTFYHHNHLGSTAITTDEEGELLTRVHYYPYGTIRETAAELPTYNFTGKERDTTTGLSYHSARYLSPTFAGWTQPDPLFQALSDKTIELPWQASNPYGYGLQNPIQYTDPEGTVAFLALVAVKLVSTAVAFAGVKIAESIAASQMDAERSKKLNHDVNSALAETAKVQATEVLAAGVGEAAGLAMSAGARYLSKGTRGLPGKVITPNAQQAQNLKRFQKKIPSNAKDSVGLRELPNGGVAAQARSFGKVPGSKAIYEKQIDVGGKTVQFTKTTYDPKGSIVHVKDKINGGTYP